MKEKKRIYLDYASITPLEPRVLKSILPYLTKNFYNPSSLYEEGRVARQAIDQARKDIALIFQVKASEIFFTTGGTESNNLALQGVFEALKRKNKKLHMITSSVEHPSVLEIFRNFETKGVKVTYLNPDEDGLVTSEKTINALRKETVLVSLMYGNNEIGTVNNISKIFKEVKKFRSENNLGPIITHTDASQGVCYLNIRADYLKADLVTIDGSKIYGPRGIGALLVKRGTLLSPIFFGGGQEEGFRSGTENTASIVGLAEAFKIVEKEKQKENDRLKKLTNAAVKKILKNLPETIINGSLDERLPNNINVCFPELDAEFLVIKLDLLGISLSSVTTCKNLLDDSSSYVIAELDKNRKTSCSKSSIRISVGRFTIKQELDKAIKIIIKEVKNYLQNGQ